MAELAVLKIDIRENVNKKDNKAWMKNGYLLGNINGKGMDSIAIALKKDEFRQTLKRFGRNCVLKLEGKDKNNFNVMVKTIQTNPKDYDYHHVDFQQVLLTENVKADVAVRFIGTEFLETKRMVLNRLMDTIPVIGLPQDIPEVIEFDVANVNAGDNIYIKDLTFVNDIKPEMDEDQLIASIIESKVREVATEETEEETSA